MKTVYKLVLWLVFSSLLAVVIYQVLLQTEASEALRTRSFLVLDKAEKLLSAIKDAETGQRGYLITGNKDYLEPFFNSNKTISSTLSELRSLTTDNADQQHRLEVLQPLIVTKLSELSQTIALYDQGQQKQAYEIVNNNLGKITMDGIRVEMAEFIALEQVIQRQRETQYHSNMKLLFLITISLSLLLVVTMYLSAYIVKRQALSRIGIERQLNADLNQVLACIRDSELRYRMLVDGTQSVAIFMIDINGYVQTWNLAGERLKGYKSSEIIGQHFSLFYTESAIIADLPNQELVKARNMGGLESEGWSVRNDGSQFWSHYYITPVYNDQDELLGYSKITSDFTYRQQLESEIANSEKNFRLLAESMPQIVWITRADGYNIFFNHQWVEYTGMTLEESYGDGWNKPFHPDHQQLAFKAWQNAVNNNGIYSLECQLRRFDGVYRWWLVRGVPVLDEQDKISKWFGTCTDIEEIKMAEKELRASIQYARSLLEASMDSLVTISAEGKLTDVNEATVNITGLPREKLIGSDFSEYFTEPDKASAGYQEVFSKGYVSDYSLTLMHISGKLTDVLYNASVFRNDKGEVAGVFAAARDITLRKAAEQRLEDAYQQLQQSLEIQVQREKLASLGVMVGGLAHEINNPLMGILNYIQFAYDHADDSRGHDVLGKALKEVNRITKLVNSMLSFVCQPVDVQQSNFSNTLNNVLTLIEGDLKRKEILIDLDLPQKLPAVNIGSDSLEQILLNLLLNAIFSLTTIVKPRKISIIVHLLTDDVIEVLIQDNGAGVQNEIRQKIFDPFFTTKPPGEGTGLGLAISKRMAEAFLGKLELTDSIQGACFRLILTIAK